MKSAAVPRRRRRNAAGTYLQLPLHLVQLPENLHQLPPLLHLVGRRLGHTPAAHCKQAQHQRLHILRVGDGRGQRCFSEVWLEMRGVAHLTFLYVFLRREENHSQRVGKQQKPARVTNDFLFHWPLRDPAVSSSCACVGPRRRWCV